MKIKEFNRILDDSAKFNITNRVNEIYLDGFVKEPSYHKKPVYQRLVLSAMAILLVCMIAVFGVVSNKPVTTLSIDINPSIEIDLNTFNNVVDIRGANDDGLAFIENLEYKGRDIDTVIEDIYSFGLEEGYFTEDDAYMLVGIYGKDIESETAIDIILDEITNITILTLTMGNYIEYPSNNSQDQDLTGSNQEGSYTTTIWSPEYQTTTVGGNEGLDANSTEGTNPEYNDDINSSPGEKTSVDDIADITDVYNVSDTLACLIIDILDFNIGYTLDNLINLEIKDLIIIFNQNQ